MFIKLLNMIWVASAWVRMQQRVWKCGEFYSVWRMVTIVNQIRLLIKDGKQCAQSRCVTEFDTQSMN